MSCTRSVVSKRVMQIASNEYDAYPTPSVTIVERYLVKHHGV